MIEFFRGMFGMRSNSGATAKERLRLVLLSDHLSLAPDLVDSLKAELLEVIARYVDIDSGNADITFEHRDREIAMLASVPVTGVRKDAGSRNGNGHAPQPAVEEPVTPEAVPQEALAVPEAIVPEAMVPEATAPEAEAEAVPAPVQSNQAARPRRRRRRRPAVVKTQQSEVALEDIPASNA